MAIISAKGHGEFQAWSGRELYHVLLKTVVICTLPIVQFSENINKNIFLKEFTSGPGDLLLDVGRALSIYLDKTKTFRN